MVSRLQLLCQFCLWITLHAIPVPARVARVSRHSELLTLLKKPGRLGGCGGLLRVVERPPPPLFGCRRRPHGARKALNLFKCRRKRRITILEDKMVYRNFDDILSDYSQYVLDYANAEINLIRIKREIREHPAYKKRCGEPSIDPGKHEDGLIDNA